MNRDHAAVQYQNVAYEYDSGFGYPQPEYEPKITGSSNNGNWTMPSCETDNDYEILEMGDLAVFINHLGEEESDELDYDSLKRYRPYGADEPLPSKYFQTSGGELVERPGGGDRTMLRSSPQQEVVIGKDGHWHYDSKDGPIVRNPDGLPVKAGLLGGCRENPLDSVIEGFGSENYQAPRARPRTMGFEGPPASSIRYPSLRDPIFPAAYQPGQFYELSTTSSHHSLVSSMSSIHYPELPAVSNMPTYIPGAGHRYF